MYEVHGQHVLKARVLFVNLCFELGFKQPAKLNSQVTMSSVLGL